MPPASKARRTSLLATSASLASPPGSGCADGETQKSRDIRDLHNSMERARRVDLRHNFDALRKRVPEIEHLEKASKLTILNKSAAYARGLEAEAARLGPERERAMARNTQLRRHLQQLMVEMNGGGGAASTSSQQQIGAAAAARRRNVGVVTTSSGRVSVPTAPGSRHYY